MPRRPKPPGIVCKPLWPNAGIAAAYQAKLEHLVDEMNASYEFWLLRAYNSEMSFDESPASELARRLAILGKRWGQRFEEAAPRLAAWFARSTKSYTDRALMAILKDAGFTVKLVITPAIQNALDSVIVENVSLITSMTTQQHTQIEGLVMRSIQRGGDLHTLTNELDKRFDMTRARAARIARDQNNKATETIHNTRRKELGITQAVWKHSHAGKEPRPLHEKADGEIYNISEGCEIGGEMVFPAGEINCRCVGRSIIPAFAGIGPHKVQPSQKESP